MTYKIVTDRELALERENERLVDKTERQSATIHVQAIAIQSMAEEIAKLKAQPVQPAPLTDAEIQTAITVAVKVGNLSWLGFDMDPEGKFTIPVLSPYHYQLARVIWNLRTGGAG